jgi:hypothetical protein
MGTKCAFISKFAFVIPQITVWIITRTRFSTNETSHTRFTHIGFASQRRLWRMCRTKTKSYNLLIKIPLYVLFQNLYLIWIYILF